MPDSRLSYAQQFADFRDNPESPFYASEAFDGDPVETWEHITQRLDGLIARARGRSSPACDFELTLEMLQDWHAELFGEAFPRDAGRLRTRREGDWEHVYFGSNVGTIRSRRLKELRGRHPRRLQRDLRKACDEAMSAISALQASAREGAPLVLVDATYVAARLYAKILRIHPWVDGNLRTSYIALQAALSALDLPAVEFKDLGRHDDMLGKAFRGDDRPYAGLAELIAEIIQGAK
jgi:fido (protein-threonine AMPylation protein)